MKNAITILLVEQDGEDGILVKFSDGTVAGFLAEELLDLRPDRDMIEGERTVPQPTTRSTK